MGRHTHQVYPVIVSWFAGHSYKILGPLIA